MEAGPRTSNVLLGDNSRNIIGHHAEFGVTVTGIATSEYR
jgi:hypothetical protein